MNPIAKSYEIFVTQKHIAGSIADLGFLNSTSSIFVVPGKLTTSGKPILVNQAVMEEENLLSPWYENNLIYQTKDRNITISGASVPGVPGVLSGMTDYMAWGISSFVEGSDSVPIVRYERLNEARSHSYLDDGELEVLNFEYHGFNVSG